MGLLIVRKGKFNFIIFATRSLQQNLTYLPRISKLPSPKRTTPKRRTMESGIPKSRTPPVTKRLNSSLDVNQYERLPESPQRSLHRASNSQKSSPISLRKNNHNLQQSPLRESNNIKHKVKPINLVHMKPYFNNKTFQI